MVYDCFSFSLSTEQPNDILCVTASIDPPIHNIASGSDLTFYCLISSNGVFSDIKINITHDSENGDERMLEPILDIETVTSLYYVLLSEVSKEDEGVYTCHVSLNCLQREDSVIISVIPEPETGEIGIYHKTNQCFLLMSLLLRISLLMIIKHFI